MEMFHPAEVHMEQTMASKLLLIYIFFFVYEGHLCVYQKDNVGH